MDLKKTTVQKNPPKHVVCSPGEFFNMIYLMFLIYILCSLLIKKKSQIVVSNVSTIYSLLYHHHYI